MNYWLIKSEPGTYSWSDLEKDKQTLWDGVRNYQARNNMKTMKLGDQCLFYHSVNEKQVVGVASVVKEFYPDPTAKEGDWVVMDVKAQRKLKHPVTLAQVKDEDRLAQMVLVRNSRLSVQPVTREEFDVIMELSER